MEHFLAIADISRDEATFLLELAARLKIELREYPERQRRRLAGKSLAMLFEKPSLRTRVSFDIGMAQLGGHPLYLAPAEIGLGTRESVPDVARVLGRMASGIMARVFAHATVRELAEHSGVPVINGLCDSEHPCQALADVLTLAECKGLEGRKLAYVGDGNNVCISLMLLCAKVGVRFAAATPPGYEPPPEAVSMASAEGEVLLTSDARAAVAGADAVYTDVWTSMGQESESAQRLQVFPPYQVNSELMAAAAPDAIVLHCLPAHRGEEITDEVIESAASRVFAQAENRLHAQKAVLAALLENA